MKRRRKLVLVGAAAVGVAAIVLGAIGLSAQKPQSYTISGPATQRAWDHDRYAAVLAGHVNDAGLVDYEALKNDLARLNAFLRQLATLSPKAFESWDDDSKVAFLINAYNALTLKVIVENYPIKPRLLSSLRFPKSSIRQIPGVWTEVREEGTHVPSRRPTTGARAWHQR